MIRVPPARPHLLRGGAAGRWAARDRERSDARVVPSDRRSTIPDGKGSQGTPSGTQAMMRDGEMRQDNPAQAEAEPP